VLSILVLALLVLFGGRLVYIQGFQASALAADALAQRTVTVDLPARRGTISDANGVVLATSVSRYDVSVNQTELAGYKHVDATTHEITGTGPAEAARLVAPLLNMDAAELAADFTGDRKFKYIKKRVLPETWDAIKALGIHGIYATEVSERVYPSGTIAGNVLGFVGGDGDGQAGVELSLQSKLAGTPGKVTYERGRTGHVIPTGNEATTAAQPGSDVELTIVRDIQYVAQHALDEQVKRFGASGGSVIVTDTRTGAVYALAESGSIDPNDPTAGSRANLGSTAAADVFEPGSTAKIITMGALLETGRATPLSRFKVADTYTSANGQVFHDSHEHPREKWTLTGILSESSNTGTVMAGQQLPEQVRYDFLSKFGFGAKTGIELGGESRGILHPVADWDGRTKYNVLFGQGVSVTALQANSVYATVANGGKRVTPHLVKATVDADGTRHETAPTVGDQVISSKVSKQLLTMLESVVSDGTGNLGAIDGYRVAGKTGTAQAADASGRMNDIVASFIGVVPADNPRLAISVIIKNPSDKISIYGGTVAAPVFSEVGSYALQELGVEPSTSKAKLYKEKW